MKRPSRDWIYHLKKFVSIRTDYLFAAMNREIVSELSASGSRNHRLLMHLMDKGAMIMGTESPELLMEEYELAKKNFTEGCEFEIHERSKLARSR